MKAFLASAALAATALFAVPAQAGVSFGISIGIPNAVAFDYDSGGYCDRWGCPDEYWDLPVYYGPVYFGGSWYQGPLYWRMHNGERWYWVRGGWRRDEWRGPRPRWWKGGYRYGPALGYNFYLGNGFRHDRDRWWRGHDWRPGRAWDRNWRDRHDWDRRDHDRRDNDRRDNDRRDDGPKMHPDNMMMGPKDRDHSGGGMMMGPGNKHDDGDDKGSHGMMGGGDNGPGNGNRHGNGNGPGGGNAPGTGNAKGPGNGGGTGPGNSDVPDNGSGQNGNKHKTHGN